MISYELVKRIKDANHPAIRMTDDELSHHQQVEIINGVTYHIPSLEEAIEACGEGIFELLRQSEWHQQSTGFIWMATIANAKNIKGLSLSEISKVMIKAGGSTPLEAVLNLWLSINKK